MRNFDRINAPPPAGIERKRAHIVGGGIAGLSAAIALVTDAHMPAGSVTIYEASPVVGGAMDASGDSETGYACRGERELEPWMECLWYVCGKVPSTQTPGRTILDETYYANLEEPIRSKFRLMHQQGRPFNVDGPQMSDHDARRMSELLLTPEEELEGKSVTDWFSPEFTRSIFWYCWSTMLAFRDYHSLMEVRRYILRFMMYSKGLTRLEGIMHTQYNEYDSIIRPMQVWLQSLGVRFRTATRITDIATSTGSHEIVATSLTFQDDSGEHHLPLTPDDLVFFTNGSLTQNATVGGTRSIAPVNRDSVDRGCFTVWEKLAIRDPRFGRPTTFIGDIDRTKWISFFVTVRDKRRFFDYMEAKTGNRTGTGGIITVVDSSWMLSFILYGKYYPDQPEDTCVLWAYGQRGDVPGDFVGKPMDECTGEEMFSELLYHCGLGDRQEEFLPHAQVSTAMMPYITSQFMPRRIGDRPRVVPEGSVNLAFMGQFVELPHDVVFTVETSVRTALMAVWSLTGLQKPMVPTHEPAFDLRVLLSNLKGGLGVETLGLADIPRVLRSSPSLKALLQSLEDVPELPPALS